MALDITLIVTGVLFSLFYGWKAVKIFKANKTETQIDKLDWAWKAHQIWLNFAGSAVGWIVLWVMLKRYSPCIYAECSVVFGVWDLLGSFIAFVGVTGYLPSAVVGFVSGLSLLGNKINDLFAKQPPN